MFFLYYVVLVWLPVPEKTRSLNHQLAHVSSETSEIVYSQGCNCGLKSGSINSEGERGALNWSLEERGGKLEGSIPSPTDSGV